jgi:internalin A
LDGLPIRRLHVVDRSIEDLEPITRLAGSLEELSIQAAPVATLDLEPLRLLRSVASEWQLMRDTLRHCDQLQSVITWQFDELDLHSFRDHVNLRRVTIKEAPYLETLSGVGGLPDLQQLGIHWARCLWDIGDVADLSESIRDLDLEKCAAVDAIDDVEPLRGLRFLGVNDCKDIASLAPLRALQELTQFHAWGSTRVVDGDLSPLQGLSHLSEIRMRDRTFYKPRLAEIRPAAGA